MMTRTPTVALACAALLVLPAGAAAAADEPAGEQPQGIIAPLVDTGGRWLPLPAELLADSGEFEACGTTLTADYADGAALEYRAEVTPVQAVVRTRSSSADVVVTRADGTSITLDTAGPSLEVYDDPDGDGDVDRTSITLFGPSLLVPTYPGADEAAARAGISPASFFTEGAATIVFVASHDPEAEQDAYIGITLETDDLQDVCRLLDQAAR